MVTKLVWRISIQSHRRAETYVCCELKCPLMLYYFNQTEVCRQILVKLPTNKFIKNTISLSRIVTSLQTDEGISIGAQVGWKIILFYYFPPWRRMLTMFRNTKVQ